MNTSPLSHSLSVKKRKLALHTLLVGSGKGGVGKSTVAVNLAVALALLGFKVGLLDADVYGPSIPIMTGLRRLSPLIERSSEGKEKVYPFHKFNIQILSVGFFVAESRPNVWRGPVIHSILEKMLFETEWGELDFFLIDLPPGTGDVLISLAQLLEIEGTLIVTTPQEVAILDAIKALNACVQLNIPLTGIIENMVGFFHPDTGQTLPLFGESKGKELAQRFDVPYLGSIPLIPSIRQSCDEGIPTAFHQGDGGVGLLFSELAEELANLIYAKERT